MNYPDDCKRHEHAVNKSEIFVLIEEMKRTEKKKLRHVTPVLYKVPSTFCKPFTNVGKC